MKSKYTFFGKNISGPFTIPAGIVTTSVEVLEKIGNEIPEIGILTTKSIGPEPRAGYKEPILARYSPFSFINAVGLTNPGADEFLKKLKKLNIPKNRFLLISIFGGNEKEFEEVARKLAPFADGFELNVSCPHSGKYGQTVGSDFKLLEKVTKAVTILGKPTLVKISPNVDVKQQVKAVLQGGASGFVAINTKGPVPYLFDDQPVLSNQVGGISGKAILELGINCVSKIRELTDKPILACGGISQASDVKKYQKAGADFFGIGTALVGLKTSELKKYFHVLLKDVEKNTNNADKILKTELNMDYKKYKVTKNLKLAEDLFSLEFDKDIKIKPGQFIFVWLPGIGEKPFSVLDDEPMSLLIQKRGCFTCALSKLKIGDTVYIRGPFGNSPKISGKLLLVGGGCGLASLYLFAKRNKNTTAVFGARDKEHLFYEKFKKVCKQIYLSTDNGEVGHKGFITDNLLDILEKEKPNYCLNCGPQIMIEKVMQIEGQKVDPEKIYSSIDYLTKCGIGLCGSCTTSKGLRSCVDGTFLNPDQI